MKRYILDKVAIQDLDILTLDASIELAQSKIITNEPLHFKHLPLISVILTDEQVLELREKGYVVTLEEKIKGELFATNYEKIRSRWVKSVKSFYTGKGCKVAVIDTGCNITYVPVDFAINYADANPGVNDGVGHGTSVCSIIKSSIGLAPDCELHIIKFITDDGTFISSALFSALSYCIDNQIDVVNMSFGADFTNADIALLTCYNAGITLCAASGNSTTITSTSHPAAYSGVIAVNAIQEDKQVYYKNILFDEGSHGINIACSGIGTENINVNGTLTSGSGTSFSCPFFVGTFALYKEQYELEDNHQVAQLILDKALKLSDTNSFGSGMITY